MKNLKEYLNESKSPKNEIYQFVEVWIDKQYQEGLVAYDDDHLKEYAKGEELPNYDEIVKAILEEFMKDLSNNTRNILKKFLEEEHHQDRKHSEVIDMIHRAIEDYTSTLEFPGY